MHGNWLHVGAHAQENQSATLSSLFVWHQPFHLAECKTYEAVPQVPKQTDASAADTVCCRMQEKTNKERLNQHFSYYCSAFIELDFWFRGMSTLGSFLTFGFTKGNNFLFAVLYSRPLRKRSLPQITELFFPWVQISSFHYNTYQLGRQNILKELPTLQIYLFPFRWWQLLEIESYWIVNTG